MASLAATDDILVVTCGPKVLAVRMDEEHLHILEPPGITGTIADGEDEYMADESSPSIVGADVSRCNKWLALCSNHKQLSLWDTSSWSLVSNRHLAKTVEKVKFVPSSKYLVVADKSGDAYLFPVLQPYDEGRLLLGHLSILLDVLVSDNEQFIITCDRDEKIRVSLFPNAYNIQSYCLGHTEFVSCLSFVSHHPSVLISGSGDGTLRFWDYVTGTQISIQNCSQEVKTIENKSCLEDVQMSQKNSQCREVPVRQVFSYSPDQNNSSIVAVCMGGCTHCIIYQVTGDTNNITCEKQQILQFSAAACNSFLTSSGMFWKLSYNECDPLNAMYLDDADSKLKSLPDNIKCILGLVNQHKKYFLGIKLPELTHLYKRKFDNVKEYLERKKARLATKVS